MSWVKEALFISALLGTALAASPQTLKRSTSPSGSSTTSFDTGAEQLPPGYSGSPFAAIIQALTHRPNLKKSEYETSDQYRQRIASLGNDRLVGNLPINGLVAFIVWCDTSLRTSCDSYDAETKTLSALIDVSESDLGPYESSIQVLESHGPAVSAGIGQNAYGARFRITKQTSERYFVKALIPTWFTQSVKARDSGNEAHIEISMEPTEARLAHGAVKQLVVGHLSDPFIDLDDSQNLIDPATPAHPIENLIHLRTLHMDIEQIWFFNSRTGEVYKKLTPVAR